MAIQSLRVSSEELNVYKLSYILELATLHLDITIIEMKIGQYLQPRDHCHDLL